MLKTKYGELEGTTGSEMKIENAYFAVLDDVWGSRFAVYVP